MPKTGYDEDEDVSRYPAADEGCCEDMGRKYGWRYLRAESTGRPVLRIQCVFEGHVEYPGSYTEKEED